jgi:hypothetical protein
MSFDDLGSPAPVHLDCSCRRERPEDALSCPSLFPLTDHSESTRIVGCLHGVFFALLLKPLSSLASTSFCCHKATIHKMSFSLVEPRRM